MSTIRLELLPDAFELWCDNLESMDDKDKEKVLKEITFDNYDWIPAEWFEED